MAHHYHIHIHRPARTRDAVKPDPDREALVAALMEAIRAREGKTRDADFKEEDHPRDHGKFTSGGGSGPSGPKPTSATAKGSKAAVHELLSSGHRFSVDELMKATGCSNKSTLMTALADLKNPKYAGKLGALAIEKHADGGYHVVKDSGAMSTGELGEHLSRRVDPSMRPKATPESRAEALGGIAKSISAGKQEIPLHPDLLAVTRPGAPIPGSGKTPTKAQEEDMAMRAGEPSSGGQVNSETSGGIIRHVIGGGVHSTSPESHRPGDTVYVNGDGGKPTKARVIRGSSVHGYEVRVPKTDGAYDVVKMDHDAVHKTAAEAVLKKKVTDTPAPGAQTESHALYHGGTFSGGKVDGVLYLTPQKSAAESYAGATGQRNKINGISATPTVSQFKLPANAKLGTAADVERVAKRLGYNVGPSMAKGQLTAPYLLDKNWMGEQDLKKLTTALHDEGIHGASFTDHDEDRRPHAATAYWGKGDVVPHTESSSSAPPELTGTAKLLALQKAAREADVKGAAPRSSTPQPISKAVHDPVEGTHHVVTLPSGAVHKIQRMDSGSSMGLPGWHVVSDKPNGKKGWEGHTTSYMGDTKQEAIRALQDREAPKEAPPPVKKTHEEVAAE